MSQALKVKYLKKIADLKKLGIDKWHWKFISDPHYTKAIALEGNNVVGVAAFSITLDTANLDFIFVKKEKRSLCAGKFLLKKCEEWAKSKKADGLGVNCGADNAGAIKFYLREGFKEIGRVKNYFSNNNLQVFFWKKP